MPELTIVTAYGRSGGSARVRAYDWVDRLAVRAEEHPYLGTADLGLTTLVRSTREISRVERALRRLTPAQGSLFLSRRASPFSRGALEARLLARAGWGVYDFDDALWVPNAGLRGSIFPLNEVWAAAVRAADMVIAGNDYLADRAAGLARNVEVIPSCVDPEWYEEKATYELGDPPVAVWLGSPTTEIFLSVAREGLLEAHRRTGMRLRLMSRGNADLGELDRMTDRVDWSLDAQRAVLAAADLAIAPLGDNEFSRGKCAYKMLQYAAAGLPMVGSPVGANALALGRFDGIPAQSATDWADALTSIVSEPTSRRLARGRRAREAVWKYYSFQEWEHTWKTAVGIE